MVYEKSEKINGMIRSPNDGVHLETPQAQTGSSSEGVRSATSGNTPCAASPAENSIPGPTSIDDTKEAELASEQLVSAARSAGATTSGSKAVNVYCYPCTRYYTIPELLVDTATAVR